MIEDSERLTLDQVVILYNMVAQVWIRSPQHCVDWTSPALRRPGFRVARHYSSSKWHSALIIGWCELKNGGSPVLIKQPALLLLSFY